MLIEEDGLLTAERVCVLLGVNKQRLRRMTFAGELASIRLSKYTVRYEASEIERFIEERRQQGGKKAKPAPRSGGNRGASR